MSRSLLRAMLAHLLQLRVFRRFAGTGHLFFRLFLAAVLIYGTQDNVFSNARLLEFRDFLAKRGFPYPLASAYLSVYAQFICGCFILVGFFVRPAALIMIINFTVALLMVHLRLPFDANISALAMLFGSIFLLFDGAGPLSIDAARERRGTG